ncbi:hypothetical protein Btru_057911 [Bulinus truncatus]|nr:hypothetical protein Btru_057911 [Bulinus truncatus]
MPRRMRKPNYTHEETMILLEQLDQHKHVIFSKGCNQQRADVWAEITVAVNSLPNSAGRTKKELKHRWKDLTHRMRLLEKKMKDSEDEKNPLSVSPYYNLVMKILGEKNESNNSAVSSGDARNHSSVIGLEDSHYDGATHVDHDVKPDKNLLFALVSNASGTEGEGCSEAKVCSPSDTNTNVIADTSDLHCSPAKSITDMSKFEAGANSSIQNKPAVGSKSRRPSRPQPSVPSSRKCLSHSKSNFTAEQKAANGIPSTHFRRALTKHSRPTMRLDPYTQEVLAIDELDSDSDTEDDVYFPSLMSEANKRSKYFPDVNGDVAATAERSPAGSRCQRKRKSSCDESHLHSLSLEELKEVYLIKKIQMVSQRTKFFLDSFYFIEKLVMN